WDNGVTDDVAFTPPVGNTLYTVTATDINNCTATDDVMITVHALPAVTASSDVTNDAVCSGDDVTLSGGGATGYSWNNGVTNNVAFIPASTATYTVTGTDANGCENTDDITITVNAL